MGLVVVFVIDCYSTVKLWQLCGLDRVQYCPKVSISAGLLWARNKE